MKISGCRAGFRIVGGAMTQDEILVWALGNGWQMIGGFPSLTKPSAPKEAIVRLVFKATVVALEVKKPAGKWEKFASAAYAGITLDDETGWPLGLGFEKIPSFSALMRGNRDRQVFKNFGPGAA